MTCFARRVQALPRAAPHGHTDPDPGLGRHTGAQLLQRRLGMNANQALDDGMGGRVQSGFLAARVRLRGHVPRGAVLAPYLFHEPATDAERVGHGALRAA